MTADADTPREDGAAQSPAPLPVSHIWRCGRFELTLDRPLVMGVLNVTPDSFSDGGRFEDPRDAVARGEQIIAGGAAILDIGGESTRPGADSVSIAEELSRVRPVVLRFAQERVPISVDTRHAEVAAGCIEAGASILNDVSGFRDRAMVDVAANSDAGVVVMHMLGDPKSMQDEPAYEDVVIEIGGYLIAQAAMLEAAGVARERIALDPGIGFGKTLAHNVEILRRIDEFAALGYPVLVGASRKCFIGTLTGVEEPSERLGGSVAAAMLAAQKGAHIVRVHDVDATVQALAVLQAVLGE